MGLRGKTCIVTGSAQGLGKEFSTRLLQAGASVTISDMNEEVGLRSVGELRKQFGKDRVNFVVCNVTKEEQLENLFQESEDFFKAPVDIFVNNAGVNVNLGWKVCMEVNIMAVMSATLMAMDRMKGRAGCQLVNIASMAGILPGMSIDSMAYTISKHGVVALSRTLGKNKEHGVDVLCLCPAWANTDIVNKVRDNHKAAVDKMVKETGLMEVERVGEAFMALLGSKNGTVLSVVAKLPLMELPDLALHRVMFTGAVAQLINKLFGVEIVRPWHLMLAMIAAIVLFQVILRIIF